MYFLPMNVFSPNDLYFFAIANSGSESKSIQVSETVEICASIDDFWDSKILPNNTLAFGSLCQIDTVTNSGRTRPAIRLVLFHFKQAGNQLQKVSDEAHPIDEMYLSQTRSFQSPPSAESSWFTEYKKRILKSILILIFGNFTGRSGKVRGWPFKKNLLLIVLSAPINLGIRGLNGVGKWFGGGTKKGLILRGLLFSK